MATALAVVSPDHAIEHRRCPRGCGGSLFYYEDEFDRPQYKCHLCSRDMIQYSFERTRDPDEIGRAHKMEREMAGWRGPERRERDLVYLDSEDDIDWDELVGRSGLALETLMAS